MKEQGFTEDELFDDASLENLSQKTERLVRKQRQARKVRKLKENLAQLDRSLDEEKRSAIKRPPLVIHGRDAAPAKPTSSSGFKVGGMGGSKEMAAIQATFMKNMQAVLDGKLKFNTTNAIRQNKNDMADSAAKAQTRKDNAFMSKLLGKSRAMTSSIKTGSDKLANVSKSARAGLEIGAAGFEVLREELSSRLGIFSKKVGDSVGDTLDGVLDDKKFQREMKDEVEKGFKKSGGGFSSFLSGLFGKDKGSTAYDRALQRNMLKGLSVGGGKKDEEKKKGVVDTIVDKVKSVVGGGVGLGTTAAIASTAAVGATAYAYKDEIAGAGRRALGWLSKQYESGKRGVGTISTGKGDAGGVSYGEYQIASKTGTMKRFLNSKYGAPYRSQFGGAAPGSAEFNKRYKQIVQQDGEAFAEAQHNFIKETHYSPLYRHAKALGFDVDNPVIANVIWSFGVQHGGAKKIFTEVARSGINLKDNPLVVKALYAARGAYIKKNGVRGADSIIKNRYRQEQKDALDALAKGVPVASAPSAKAKPLPPPPTGVAAARERALEALEGNVKKSGVAPGSIGERMTRWAIENSDTVANLYDTLNAPSISEARRRSRESTGRAQVVPQSQRKPVDPIGAYSPAPDLQVSSGYGVRAHPVTGGQKMHRGQDYKMPVGTAIYAVNDGVVIQAGWDSKGGGNFIRIRHPNGFCSAYLHLSKVLVKKGDNVVKGQKIGLSGNTGTSTGPHLHYQVDKGTSSTSVDPSVMPYTGIAALSGAEMQNAPNGGGQPATGAKPQYSFGRHSGVVGGTQLAVPSESSVSRPSNDSEMSKILVGGTDPYSRMLDEFRVENFRRAQRAGPVPTSTPSAPMAGQGTDGSKGGGGSDQQMYLAIEDQALASLLMQGITAR